MIHLSILQDILADTRNGLLPCSGPDFAKTTVGKEEKGKEEEEAQAGPAYPHLMVDPACKPLKAAALWNVEKSELGLRVRAVPSPKSLGCHLQPV